MEYLDDLAFMNVGTLNGHVHQTTSELETRLTFSPKQITLKVSLIPQRATVIEINII